jgi:hypothetical protein
MEPELRFPSKIDWWMPTMIGLVIVSAPIAIVLGAKHSPFTRSTIAVLVVGLALPVGLLGWMWSSTMYVISGNELRISSGPMKVLVPIDSISRIRRSNSPASSPALSLSRLEIHYGRFNEVLISPKDRRGFIRAIVARVPNVVLEDLDEYR